MNFQFVGSPPPLPDEPIPVPPSETTELLRQMVELQKEQLAMYRASSAAHDHASRWRAFLARWQEDFPDLPESCRHAVPILERAYITLIAELADHIQHNGSLDNEFTLGEFLDRYGMRLSQLGTILSLVAPLADAAGSAGSQEGSS
jgi:hypothetical protein